MLRGDLSSDNLAINQEQKLWQIEEHGLCDPPLKITERIFHPYLSTGFSFSQILVFLLLDACLDVWQQRTIVVCCMMTQIILVIGLNRGRY